MAIRGRPRAAPPRAVWFAYIAAALSREEIKAERLLEQLGVTTSSAAVGRVRREMPTGAIRPWLLVDIGLLGLQSAVVHIGGAGRRQDELLDWLKRVAGVTEVAELSYDRTVIVRVIYPSPETGRQLRDEIELHIQEHWPGRRVTWEEVVFESCDAAANTWLRLADLARAERKKASP